MNTFTIAWRELKKYFRSPSAFIILTMWLLYQGLIFYVLIRVLNRPDVPRGAPMRWFFGGVIWFHPIFAFLVAMLTAGLLAEEQRSRSLESLMTAPVRESEVVLGKFLGALGFFAFMWLWTVLYVVILLVVAKGQTLKAGPLLSSYLGCMLVGGLGLSLGLFTSSLTRDTLLAGLLSGLGLLMFFILKLMLIWNIVPAEGQFKLLGISWFSWENVKLLIERIMFIDFMEDFSKGIVDTKYLFLLLSATALLLFSSMRVLQLRKWR